MPQIHAKQLQGTAAVGVGGTGTSTQFTSGSVVFAGGSGAYAQDNSNFAWDNTSKALTAGNGIVIKEGADHPVAAAAGTGILWVKNTDPATLFFTDDAGTDFDLTAGGGTPAGTDGQLQYNNGGAFGGVPRLVYDGGAVVYLGPISSATPSVGKFSATKGVGTNIGGADFEIYTGVSTGNAAAGDVVFYGGSVGSSGSLENSSQERMRITSAGLVGIGQLSPTETFEVSGSSASGFITSQVGNTGGNASSNARLRVLTSTGNAELSLDSGANDSRIFFRRGGNQRWEIRNDQSDSDRLKITNNGGNTRLTIDSTGRFQFTTTTSAAVSDSGSASFRVSSSDRLQLSNNAGAYADVATVPGASGHIVYNKSGVLGAESGFRYDDSPQSLHLQQSTFANGSPFVLRVQSNTNSTAFTASTDTPDILFDLAFTRTFATGALTDQRAFKILRPTYAFSGVSTITNAATVYINNAPEAGTNATITNAYALWVDDGEVRIDGKLTVGGLIDPTGMQFTQVGANPGDANTLWVNSSGGALMFGASEAGGSTSPAGSDGQVQFNSSSSFGADAGFNWDDTNKRLGVGTATPDFALEVGGTVDGIIAATRYSSIVASGGVLIARRANGSEGTPTAVLSGETIGLVVFGGYSGSAFANPCGIQAISSENFTGTNAGSELQFLTAAVGTTARVVKLAVKSDGGINFQNSSAAAVSAANTASLRTTAGGILQVSNNGAAYTNIGGGSVSGSDGQVQYNNGGSFGGGTLHVWDDVNNRLGIGVAAPENKLHVRQSGQSACRFEREEATTNAALGVSFIQAVSTGDMVDNFGPQLSFGIKDDAAVSNAIAYIKAVRAGADNTGKLILGTRDAGAFADRIIIEAGGNVGIGVVATQKLHVLGNVRVQNTGAADAVFKCDNSVRSWDMGANSAGTWRLRDITGALDRITVLSSGNVGIGISPTTKLDVDGTIRATATGSALVHIQNTAGGDATVRTQNTARNYDAGVSSTGSFRVRDLTAAADRFIITNAGYVGIGVIPTSQGLRVDGNIICHNSTFGISLTSNAGNNRFGLKYGSAGNTGDTDDIMLSNRETNGGLLFATDNGTSGGAGETLRLSIAGGTAGGALQFQGSASAGVSAANTARLRSTASGVLQVSENAGAYTNLFGSTTAAGSTGELQFNNAGVLGADSQLFWDGTNNRLAIGASAATRKLHVIDSGMTTRLERTTGLTNAALSGIELMTKTSVNMVNGLGSGIDFMIQDDTVGPNIIAQIYAFRDGADDSGAITFRTFSAGIASENIRLTAAGNVLIGTTTDNAKLAIVGGGIICGAPTGGDKGSGTINVAGDVYKNNTAYANPDYVFEHYFTGSISKFIDSPGAKEYKGLRSLGDVKSFVKENQHLPHIVKEATGIFSRGDKALELIEELFLHAFALEDKIKVLEAAAAGGE